MTQTASAIDVSAVRALLAGESEVLLVDVRTPGEYQTAHIAGSVNLPLDQVEAHLDDFVAAAGPTMVMVCQSGNRAGRCQARLAAAGASGARVLSGGLNAWLQAGAPLVRGRQRWALERQVRLVAGGIVLASIIASVWVPGARFVAGLIGAGLTFAALSDTCAMGLMLSKLPYNQPRNAAATTAAVARLREHGTGR
ncbi:rhodanese-like domain-containing protein [Catellatospora chokoriensis]|uniref:Sulfurtransferase n=1 Tax=Catellatospora chokoriensis TaxID=310353 RepID=A0A8J3NSC3_9ACTN|nr:rhodanese-like domain-containing protein [Catellatospora chokoriensis]GIF90358.1 sulfurtransferase [Catellatospora chokoriensis]